MPDSPSPFDDPFADLFGKLPSPRSRDGRAVGEGAGHGGGAAVTPPSDAVGSEAVASDTATPEPAAPLSRRAAREAAAHQDSSTTPEPVSAAPAAAAPVAAAPVAAEPMPSTPVSAATTSAAPVSAGAVSAVPASAVPASAVPVRTEALTTGPVVEPWALSNAAPSYSRGAETATVAPAAATATLDDLFTGRQSTDILGDVPPPKNKRKRRIGGWIALAVVLLLLGGVAAGGLWVWNTYETKIREFMGWEEPKDYEDGLANGEVLVTVVTGDTGASISQTLFEQGVTKTSSAFYDYLIDTGQNPPFEPGVFALQKQMTSAAALTAIMDPASRRENTAQLREGLTVEQSLPLLADATGIPIEDFQAAVADPAAYGVPVDQEIVAAGGQPLEGWLFPATYTFNPGLTAKDVITTLVNRTVQSLDAAGVPVDDRERVLTVASIIQREARAGTDFYKVSRVIENRLNASNQETFGLLQMDSTAQYGFGEADGTVSTSADAQYDDNPWNTYVRAGLPVGPIANPGDEAIDAAMHPADGDWLYFVTVNLDTGETVFTSNLADHNKAVAQWQTWCKANPNSGC